MGDVGRGDNCENVGTQTLIHSGRFDPQPKQSMLSRIQVLHEFSTRISSHFCAGHNGTGCVVSKAVELYSHQS